jgi:TonB family protein
VPSPTEHRPANDLLKDRFEDVFAVSLIAATLAHFVGLQIWPAITVPDWSNAAGAVPEIVDLETIPLTAPPERLARPAPPVVVSGAPVEATIPVVRFDQVVALPPPDPPPSDPESASRRPFTPFEVAPRLTNPEEFARALMRAYPVSLRSAGIGGTVTLLVHIDESGRVLEARVDSDSGYQRLDETALDLVGLMRFTPALNRDRRVAVWVELPIEFRTRDRASTPG